MRQRSACLALALVFVVAGCSEQPDEDGGRAASPPPVSPPASGPAAATTTPSNVDSRSGVCRLVDVAAKDQSVSAAFAVVGEEGPAMRASVAQTYKRLAGQLTRAALQAPPDLQVALTQWALASTEVAQFVADHKPRPGLVLEFGPGHRKWKAAQKSVEKICGHPVPNTR
ncbi:hypothetical protein KBX06_20035 [Micromonospora sp. C31]|uniref:hypothetical protein n=1 Tax=Micromonospora sp. C31 TaxID=2824876 RepID=UPI001B364B8B|nr:hypothetical protein [Micromonospora sp. C31]MBQ1075437.1 hypothetical protein [Micromonospora sp. C31]